MFSTLFCVVVGFYSIFSADALAGSHVGVNVVTPRGSVAVDVNTRGATPYGGPARRAVRRGYAAAALYSPYIGYWPNYPAASYYAGSLGYWQSSNGAYGSVYTQPGMFSSYHYGPYSSGSTYLTPTSGSHTGLYNFSYTRVPGQSLSLTGSGPGGGTYSLNANRSW